MSDWLVEEQYVEVLKSPETEQVVGESWYKFEGGPMHRTDGPANFRYFPGTNRLDYVEFMQDGQLHRAGGQPAVTYYCEQTGNPSKFEFWVEGQLHRLGSPAVILLDSVSGLVLRSEFYEFGARVNPPQLSEPRLSP